MEYSDLLAMFGLTKQESLLYKHLLCAGSVTGYEAAKSTGISRSNAYTSLASLCEKGAAIAIEGTPARYIAVSVDEFCKNQIRSRERAAKKLRTLLAPVSTATEGYLNIVGAAAVANKISNMLEAAQLRAYLAIGAEQLERFLPELRQMLDKGLKTVIITDAPFTLEGACIHLSESRGNQVRIITDSSKVLTGELDDSPSCSCLYSEREHLVQVVKDSLKYELKILNLNHTILEE